MLQSAQEVACHDHTEAMIQKTEEPNVEDITQNFTYIRIFMPFPRLLMMK